MVYDMNETMKLIGQQNGVELIAQGGIAAEDFHNVVTVHIQNGSNIYDVSIDAFVLGYIYGKRAERKKKVTNL